MEMVAGRVDKQPRMPKPEKGAKKSRRRQQPRLYPHSSMTSPRRLLQTMRNDVPTQKPSNDDRDRLLQEFLTFSAEDGPAHNGTISSFLFDQIGLSSGIVNATVQSGGLVQVLASLSVANGLRDGTLTIMRSGGAFTGNVVAQSSKRITAQLRFLPASSASIVAPLIAWQILHAIAGVQQLARINARLDSLQRGLERLTFRQQARTIGQLAAAIATLEDLSEQFRTSGSFTNDMLIRLALADRDIQSSLAEQRVLVQRFEQLSSQITENARGKQGAVSANQLLKEEAAEFLIDAKILTTASKASLLSTQAWLRYDLEHNSANVPRRLKDLETELWNAMEFVEPLTLIQELDEHAKQCVEQMNWCDRCLFSRGLADEVRGRRMQGDEEHRVLNESSAPSVLIWKGGDNRIQSVIVDSKLTEGNTSNSAKPAR